MANINSVQGNPIVVGMTGLDSDVHAAFDAKMDVEGYYPMDGITGGGPLDTASWLLRACPGTDGPARIESIHGKTVRWNQLAEYTGTQSTTINGVTITDNNDGSFTLNGTATEQVVFNVGTRKPFAVGHKELVKGCPAGGSITTFRLKDEYGTGADLGSGLIETRTNDYAIPQIAIANGYTCDNLVFRPQLFDLTLMFGAGNEPSTVAEFEQMYPESYYPYDAGSLLPVRMTGVESVGDGWTFQRAIDTGVLRSAGTVYDELTATERITRVGEVDLGTLTWVYETSGTVPFFRTKLPSDYAAPPSAGVDNLECAKYEAGESTTKSWFGSNERNGQIRPIYGQSYNVGIQDSAYTDAAAFKTAMSGVMLHYALATPTTTPIDPPLNLTYKAAASGTERILHTDMTAPPTLVVQYGSTADGIRDRALATIATLEGSVSQHNYSVGDYLTFDGYLCRVTVAIATGESIVIGSNVTVTTVMQEVLSLLS